MRADGAVIVSDGEDDETIIPVIHTILPIISVQRVIIRHSQSVEYSYAILGRYIKMLVYDPRYSKFFLKSTRSPSRCSRSLYSFWINQRSSCFGFKHPGYCFHY